MSEYSWYCGSLFLAIGIMVIVVIIIPAVIKAARRRLK